MDNTVSVNSFEPLFDDVSKEVVDLRAENAFLKSELAELKKLYDSNFCHICKYRFEHGKKHLCAFCDHVVCCGINFGEGFICVDCTGKTTRLLKCSECDWVALFREKGEICAVCEIRQIKKKK